MRFSVIPAKAGIQLIQVVLDSCFRRSDGFETFYEAINFRLQIFSIRLPQENCS